MRTLLLTSIAALFLATGTAHADDFEGFPEKMRGVWCISLSESTKTRIILNPEDSCEHFGGRVFITASRYFGSEFDCGIGIDTPIEIEPAREIEEGSASALYHVYGACVPGGPAWTDFTIQRIEYSDGNEKLVITLSTQG